MSGQKGSFLDKLKAFFIRRREYKKMKKDQERKELEEILKNISEKVQPIGTIVHTYFALDNIDVRKISLSTPKRVVHINDNVNYKETSDDTNKNIIDDVFDLDDMNLDGLKELKSNLINKKKDDISIEDKIINEFEQNDKDDKKIDKNIPADDTLSKQDRRTLFVSKKRIKIDENKKKDKNIIFKSLGMFKFPSKNKKKSSEEEMSLILIRMIDKNLYELDYLKEELNYLTESNKKAKTKDEVFEIEQRFLILKERLEEAYHEFIDLKNSNLVVDIPDLKYNEEFVFLVEKYKLDIYDNDIVKQTLIDIENRYKTSLNILESIVVLEESKDIIDTEVNKDKTDILVGNYEISLTDDTILKLEFMKSELEKNLSYNKSIVDDAIKKVNTIKPEEKVRYHYHIMRNLIDSAINFSFSYAMLNPRRGRLSNMLGAVCMLNSIRLLSHVFEPEKEVYFVSSCDFEAEIKEHLNDFDYVKENIDLSISEIENIKSNFLQKYSSLSDYNIEINDTLKNINNLENQLKDMRVEMIIQESRLNQTLSKNNQIVKKIEYDNKNEEIV